jgi:hypothetical protein
MPSCGTACRRFLIRRPTVSGHKAAKISAVVSSSNSSRDSPSPSLTLLAREVALLDFQRPPTRKVRQLGERSEQVLPFDFAIGRCRRGAALGQRKGGIEQCPGSAGQPVLFQRLVVISLRRTHRSGHRHQGRRRVVPPRITA